MTEEIRPAHYKHGGIETWDVIETFKLNFNTGNVFKYISRYDNKELLSDKIKDLSKALTYINREISILKDKEGNPLFIKGEVSPCLHPHSKLKSLSVKQDCHE